MLAGLVWVEACLGRPRLRRKMREKRMMGWALVLRPTRKLKREREERAWN